MLRTPTYHVFDLYREHQGARSIRLHIDTQPISFAVGQERRQLSGLLGSASIRGDRLLLTIVNPHASLPIEADLGIASGAQVVEAARTVLTHEDLTAHNTFDQPDTVSPSSVESLDPAGVARHVFAPRSITALRLRLS